MDNHTADIQTVELQDSDQQIENNQEEGVGHSEDTERETGYQYTLGQGHDPSVENWDSILDEYEGLVFNTALVLTGSTEQAEDITRGVFSALFRSLSEAPQRTITRMTILQLLYSATRENARELSQKNSSAASSPRSSDDETSTMEDLGQHEPSDEIMRDRVLSALSEVYSDLPSTHRGLKLLRDVANCSRTELCAIANRSVEQICTVLDEATIYISAIRKNLSAQLEVINEEHRPQKSYDQEGDLPSTPCNHENNPSH